MQALINMSWITKYAPVSFLTQQKKYLDGQMHLNFNVTVWGKTCTLLDNLAVMA